MTIQVFEDPQCPFCQEWNVDTLPTVVQKYVQDRAGVKLVYRGIEIIGPNSERACARSTRPAARTSSGRWPTRSIARQGQENSGWIDAAVIATRRQGGRREREGDRCIGDEIRRVTAQLVAASQAAKKYQVGGTPTFVVERPPGLPHAAAALGLDPASFSAALDPLLQ